MNQLSPRQESIFNRVVDTHIETAQPVGSQSITVLYNQLYRDSYSSATVRSEMGRLEEMGYLTHPHTSAGRIPTDLGYRYYVDHGVQYEELSESDLRQVEEEFRNATEEFESFAEIVSEALSTLSQEISIVLVPANAAEPLGGKNRARFFVKGVGRILEKPEFQDLEKARLLFEAFDERNEIIDWIMKQVAERGISTTIGQENQPAFFRDCSIITTQCWVHGKSEGVFAIVGPRRMRYGRVIPLLNRVARLVNCILG